MANVQKHLAVYEGYSGVIEADLAHALVKFIFCGSQRVWHVIVERFGISKSSETSLDAAQLRRKRGTHELKAFVDARHARIEALKVHDYLLEFGRGDLVIL